MTLSDELDKELRMALQGINNQLTTIAVTNERVVARLESLEKWRTDQERARERARERAYMRRQKAPEDIRGTVAIIIALAALVLPYLVRP